MKSKRNTSPSAAQPICCRTARLTAHGLCPAPRLLLFLVMFCRHDLKDETVYQMTKSFWEHIDELGQSQKNLKGLKPAEAVKDIAKIPLHPGAEKYYKEIEEIGVLK